MKRALGIVRQVLAGLAHAHAQGIVHRDIKPDNIILTEAIGLGEQVRITKCAEFLVREVGAPATPFLEEAASSDSYANVRARASHLLSRVNARR